ncbi:MAG: 7-carboxy-7-deazaguanine synthase [Pyrococcus sp.]|uniref:7-carboxy-7-deazaguanine synthase QueE n=1 Tax=Pyrococcus sp. TaxID=33866 RepID=UPI002589B748|nr:7-carboxy-7-deazaguanine synthase QueE [Pyrococcus sp.]MDK2869118.1 7-carboxy-7-deazaguanine synthase [Pyrococcus sp.]
MVKVILGEIFNSWQGEGGSVEGSAFGRRQIFVRFAGCDLRCVYCDSREYIDPRSVKKYRVEVEPFSGKFEYFDNPADVEEIVKWITKLDTGDIHSISYTGGEPTLQILGLASLMEKAKELGYDNFLETHGGYPNLIKRIAPLTDYASVDIKDESANATKDWRKLVINEITSAKILKEAGAKVYVKLVVTRETRIENVRWYAEMLKGIAPMVIQPKEPMNTPINEIMGFYNVAAKIMGKKNVGLSFQVHKYLGVL